MTEGSTYEVLWPGGRTASKDRLGPVRRLPDLGGKTVAFIWDYVFRGDEMFEIIKDELNARAADVSFVDYDVFGDTHGADERAVVADIPNKLLQHRVDAAIVGVGA